MACHEVHVKPGGKLNDLCQVAISRIGKDMCNTIIYFIAGIPDINFMTSHPIKTFPSTR
jgi:hypothetical protein